MFEIRPATEIVVKSHDRAVTIVARTNYIVASWRKVGPVVECPTTDPNVVGSNPGDAEIGLHVFHKAHNWTRELVDLFTQEAVIESDLAKL